MPTHELCAMRIHELAVDGALASLNSNADGLSAPEAARRLAEFGPNRLEDVARERLWLSLAREFTHFFAIILWLAAALAFTADWLQPGEGMGRLGVAILCVILINGLFSFWQEYKAEQATTAIATTTQEPTTRQGWRTAKRQRRVRIEDMVLLAATTG